MDFRLTRMYNAGDIGQASHQMQIKLLAGGVDPALPMGGVNTGWKAKFSLKNGVQFLKKNLGPSEVNGCPLYVYNKKTILHNARTNSNKFQVPATSCTIKLSDVCLYDRTAILQ